MLGNKKSCYSNESCNFAANSTFVKLFLPGKKIVFDLEY